MSGLAVAQSKMTFTVPGRSAAEVVAAVALFLGYPNARLESADGMVTREVTTSGFSLAFGSRAQVVWESALRANDEPDGTQGDYAVIRWQAKNGVPMAWKEMEVVSHRVGDALTSVGGSVKISGSP